MTRIAVLWDMDGTLIDSEWLHVVALAEALRTQALHVPEELSAAVSGKSAEAVHAWVQRELGLSMPFRSWIELKYSIYLSRVSEITFFPASIHVWRNLQDRGVLQGIVSNSDRMIVDANLRQLGLSQPKLVSVSRNDVINGKPDPEPYLRAAYLLGVAPENCIALEDTMTGAEAGRAAGMQTYLVPHTPAAPTPGISQLADMNDIAKMCRL